MADLFYITLNSHWALKHRFRTYSLLPLRNFWPPHRLTWTSCLIPACCAIELTTIHHNRSTDRSLMENLHNPNPRLPVIQFMAYTDTHDCKRRTSAILAIVSCVVIGPYSIHASQVCHNLRPEARRNMQNFRISREHTSRNFRFMFI